MDTRAYHHGNLRRMLIEKGLEMIHQEGDEMLSLRKIAVQCGVSNAAPYAHFKNKDELLLAMQNHVMNEFTQTLERAVSECKDKSRALLQLGTAYVKFFYQNPQYYSFLFSRKNLEINLFFNPNNTIPPLELLRVTTKAVFQNSGLPESVIEDKVIAMWALVHGLSAIVIMPNVAYSDDWEAKITEIIGSITMSCDQERK